MSRQTLVSSGGDGAQGTGSVGMRSWPGNAEGRGLSEGNRSVLLASFSLFFLFFSHCAYLGISSAT